jgi:integrase
LSIRKDRKSGVYFVDLRTPSGERVRCSTRTTDYKKAEEYHDTLKAQFWRQKQLGEAPDRLFEEGALEFLRNHEGEKDYANKARHIQYWRGKFAGRALRSLTAAEIKTNLPQESAHKHRKGPLSNATKNRYLATIKTMHNECVDLEWISHVPKVKKRKEPKERVRWEPQGVIKRLIERLRLSWRRDAVLVAVATGMRESELFTLTAAQVNLALRAVYLEDTKSGYSRAVPLNDDALEVIARRIEGKARDALVFTRGADRSSLADAALVAASTGLRQAQVLSLTPARLDLAQRTAYAIDATTGERVAVSLNTTALAILHRRAKRKTADACLLPRAGVKYAQIDQHDKRDFARACREVGIKDFRWHDLRHTWASWHAQAGTPLLDLQKLGGWESIEMVQKYAHLAPSHVAVHANAVKFWSSSREKEKAPTGPVP